MTYFTPSVVDYIAKTYLSDLRMNWNDIQFSLCLVYYGVSPHCAAVTGFPQGLDTSVCIYFFFLFPEVLLDEKTTQTLSLRSDWFILKVFCQAGHKVSASQSVNSHIHVNKWCPEILEREVELFPQCWEIVQNLPTNYIKRWWTQGDWEQMYNTLFRFFCEKTKS